MLVAIEKGAFGSSLTIVDLLTYLYMYKEDLALHNLQWLICHKTTPNQTKPIIVLKMAGIMLVKHDNTKNAEVTIWDHLFRQMPFFFFNEKIAPSLSY